MARDCTPCRVGVVPRQLFSILTRCGLVNEKRATPIAERTGRHKLAFGHKPRRILPMHRSQRGNLFRVVLDVIHEFHSDTPHLAPMVAPERSVPSVVRALS